MLHSLSRFAPGASFPILLNLVLIVALLLGDHWRAGTGNDELVAYVLAIAVAIGGVLQLLWLWFWPHLAGLPLTLHLPPLTPVVRELGTLIVPALFGPAVSSINHP